MLRIPYCLVEPTCALTSPTRLIHLFLLIYLGVYGVPGIVFGGQVLALTLLTN